MDVTFINPFLEAAVNVLQIMAFTETQVGKPFLSDRRQRTQDLPSLSWPCTGGSLCRW
jgi:CheY-specific phosphatase CheX